MSVVLLLLPALGCEPRRTPFERSCAGQYIDGCMPYEYARVLTASFTPERLRPSDSLLPATLHATFQTCGVQTPAPPALQISAVVGSGSIPVDARRDGGSFMSGQRIIQLGTYFNTSSNPLVFDAVVDNPFDATTIPGNTDLVLRFRPLINACEGEGIEMNYRTGAPLP